MGDKLAKVMNEPVDFWEVISGRRSVLSLQNRQVPENLIRDAMEFAILAPSAHNAQPWRFIWLKDKKTRTELLTAMTERFVRDMAKDEVPTAEQKRRANESLARFGDAPVLMLAGISMLEMDKYSDTFRRECEKFMAVQCLSAAIENLLLALHGFGLASRWYCAPLFCPDVVRETLKLPGDFEAQAFITAGYPGVVPPRPRRKPLQEILFER